MWHFTAPCIVSLTLCITTELCSPFWTRVIERWSILITHAQHDGVNKWKHFRVAGHLCGECTGHRWIPHTKASEAELWYFFDLRLNKGAATCAVGPESAWLLTFWLVAFQQVWSHGVHCGAVRPANQAKKMSQTRCEKTATAAPAAEAWFAKLPLDYMLHNTHPWKWCGRRSSMWRPYSLWRNLPPAACRLCDHSLNGWVNNRKAGDLRRHRTHYDVTVMMSLNYVIVDAVTPSLILFPYINQIISSVITHACSYSGNTWLCVHWQWNTREWCH